MKSSINFPIRHDFSSEGQSVFNISPTMSKDNWGDSGGARKIIASTSNGERLPNLRRGCFEYDDPHLASECLRRKSPKVMVAQANARDLDEGLDNNNYETLDILDEVDDGVMAGVAKVNPLCFAIGVSHSEHLYLAARINGHACNAMIDSGVTHNFFTPECSTKFGLKNYATEGHIHKLCARLNQC